MKPKRRASRVQRDFQQALRADRKTRAERVQRKRAASQTEGQSQPFAGDRQALKAPKLSYSQKLAKIQKYVDFKFKHPDKLGRANKALISRNYTAISRLKSENYIYIPRITAKRRKIIEETLGGNYSTTHLKGAFIPYRVAGPGRPGLKFKWKKNKFTISAPDLPLLTFYPINAEEFAASPDPKAFINQLISDAPDDAIFAPLSKKDGVLARFGFKSDKTKIADLVAAWLESYGISGQHDMRDWFVGIKVIEFFPPRD